MDMETAAKSSETEEMVSEMVSMETAAALKQLQDSVALQGLEDTADAFHEACQHHASIVVQESNPLWFLRFEKDNVSAAARRMVSYWHERKQAFGAERAFLPMNLSSGGGHDDDGAGALLPHDVDILKAGHWLHLPRCEKNNRTVLCHDLSKQPQQQICSSSFIRIIFFMLQIALENDASRDDTTTDHQGGSCDGGGFVLLINVSNPYAAAFDEVFEQTMLKFMTTAMPMKIGHVHLICRCPLAYNSNHKDKQAFLETTLVMAQKRLGSLLDQNKSTQIVAHSNQDCLQQLSLQGLSKEGVPACFGGSFSSSAWEPWRRPGQVHEFRLQLQVDLPCLVRNTLWTYTQAKTDAAAGQASPDQIIASLTNINSNTYTTAGRRAVAASLDLDAGVTMTKNKKRSVPLKPKVQGPNRSTTVDHNTKRRAIGAKNPTSTSSTQGGEGEGEEDPRDKKRRMDAVYAQRKREKLRIETEVLGGQCQEATAINTSLKKENQRLEALVHAAKQLTEQYENSHILNAAAAASFGAAAYGAGAGAGAYYPAASWQQPYPLPMQLQQQDFRLQAASLASLPAHQQQQQLLLAQQQNPYYHLRGFAPGGMLR